MSSISYWRHSSVGDRYRYREYVVLSKRCDRTVLYNTGQGGLNPTQGSVRDAI